MAIRAAPERVVLDVSVIAAATGPRLAGWAPGRDYGPWFALGAIAWTRLAWRYTTSPRRVDSPADQGGQADRMRAIAPRSGGMAQSR